MISAAIASVILFAYLFYELTKQTRRDFLFEYMTGKGAFIGNDLKFSERIIQNSNPEHLILIDPLLSNVRFNDSNVSVIAMRSDEASLILIDTQLEWVYLAKSFTISDLRTWGILLIPGGYIMGNGYYKANNIHRYDVAAVVDNFVLRGGYELVEVTNDQFVIKKKIRNSITEE